jgi:hypothetical protein
LTPRGSSPMVIAAYTEVKTEQLAICLRRG